MKGREQKQDEKLPINDLLNNSELDSVVLENNLAKIAYTLDKDYLAHLDDYGVFKFEQYCKTRGIEYKENQTKNFMAIKVTNFIINKDEKVIDCMKNIIGSFSNSNDSLAFLVHRKIDSVDLYFIFKKDGEVRGDIVENKLLLLEKSFKGNFPGSSTEKLIKNSLIEKEFLFLDEATNISMLSSIPSDKSEDYISQGIEKLLNGFVPTKKEEEYSVLILAESITQEGIRDIINGFEEMATSITPYAGHQFQTGINDSESNGEMKSSTDTTGVSHAISKTHSINFGANAGRSSGTSSGTNSNISDSQSNTTSESDTFTNSEQESNGESENSGVTRSGTAIGGSTGSVAGAVIGGIVGTFIPIPGVGTTLGATIGGMVGKTVGSLAGSIVGDRSKNKGTSHNTTKGTSSSHTKGTSQTDTHSVSNGVFDSVSKVLSIGISGGYGYSWGKIDTNSESKSITDGTNHNITIGTSENTTYSYKSYQVSDLLENLESTIKRLMESKSTGLWKTATYIFSKEGATSRSVANYLKGLTQGDESFIESSIIHDWKEEREIIGGDSVVKQNTVFPEIKKYLSYFTHPILLNYKDYQLNQIDKNEIIKQATDELIKQGIEDSYINLVSSAISETNSVDIIPITPTTNISTTELAKIFSLPSHSLPGLPVLECAEFGRNVATYDTESKSDASKIELGVVYHMHNKENLPVELQKKSLALHTFITGSTGSGKSNTVYQMLSQVNKNKGKFLVIEPAKGEYKNIFGKHSYIEKDENNENKRSTEEGIAKVYSTNPKISDLLKINPFSFPSDIHILEHLDRLIEIFNVCWPMYAAMPAVLKEAVEKSYEDAGWDLTESTNDFGNNLYPTFADVTRNIKIIIDSSDYDAENKGAYKGSLITRLKSLTNGINGQIFTTDAISDKDLFDENVIIDLSRVGSSETKSLIMGLLILKLQEYRMTQGKMNADLNHVTVLEEAHNLLKRTSTEVSSESANLLGKSVEMLTNAIAEMRTYGEGFIIADQAPGLLDMAVIRNTNTKIIMRLPDLGDRELVGKAANLNDKQIEELAKLPCGVAAVYQNEWVQPVLCQVTLYDNALNNPKYVYNKCITKINSNLLLSERLTLVKDLCQLRSDSEKILEIENKLKIILCENKKTSGVLYVFCMNYIKSARKKPDYDKLAFLVSSLLPEFSKTIRNSALLNPCKIDIWRNDLQDHIENVLIAEKMMTEIELRNNILQCILHNYVLFEINKPNLLKELRQNHN